MGERLGVELTGELGRGVGRKRHERRVLVLPGRVASAAVGAGAAGVHQPPHPGLAGRVEHGKRAGGARGVAGERVFDAFGDRGQRREVEHGLATGHGPGHCIGVGHTPADQFRGGRDVREVRRKPGGEVVEYADRAPGARERLREVRTDEPAATGDQSRSAHRESFVWVRVEIGQ